jgi:glucose dehydrogenase
MVRFAYLVELVSIAAFFYNAIIILATLFAGIPRPGLQWWFLSLLVITMGVPLSWFLFYKSLFNSAQTDGATYSYIRSFLLIIIHMVSYVTVAQGVGELVAW